jgi:hypothetical protein
MSPIVHPSTDNGRKRVPRPTCLDCGYPPGPARTPSIVRDPDSGRLITEVHRAAEEGNALAADSVLRVTVTRLLDRHGSVLPARAPDLFP